MDKAGLARLAAEFVRNAPENVIPPEAAIGPGCGGVRIYGDPLLAFGSADDPLFEKLKDPGVVSAEHMSPKEWLPQAASVVSWFLPFSDEVKNSNAGGPDPSPLWLHARIEGEDMNNALRRYMCGVLEGSGAVAPVLDPRWKTVSPFCSNWSERHAAYICGLGTFGLSKSLITKKGTAGRFGSVITGCAFEPDEREYEGLTQWCSMCGACARSCPAGAIDPSRGPLLGKDHASCSAYVQKTARMYGPEGTARLRYGCGKCQTGVPCQNGPAEVRPRV